MMNHLRKAHIQSPVKPYYHDTAYKYPALREVTIIDHESKCLVTKVISCIDVINSPWMEFLLQWSTMESVISTWRMKKVHVSSKIWNCDVTCKTFYSEEKQTIIDFKSAFSKDSVEDARALLQNLDNGCENGHYSQPYDIDLNSEESSSVNQFKELKGHTLQCTHGFCNGQIHLVRPGAIHYPALRTLLNSLYRGRRSDNGIRKIESDLSEGCLQSLVENLSLQDPSQLLDDIESLTADEGKEEVKSSLSASESHLEAEFAAIIEEL